MSRRWTEDGIRRELEAFLPGFEVFPSYPVFRASGAAGGLAGDGRPWRAGALAEEYGLRYTRHDRALGDGEVRARLRAALRGGALACWPSRRWLAERAGPGLVAAIDRHGGPRRWVDELGVPLRHVRGQRWTPETIAAELEPLLAGRSRRPSRVQFERAGLSGLWSAIHDADGHAAMAARYGLALTRRQRSRAGRASVRP